MHNLKNLTNSPYPIALADGSTVMLPARGELERVDLHPMIIRQVKACGYVEVIEAPDAPRQEVEGDTKPVKPRKAKK